MSRSSSAVAARLSEAAPVFAALGDSTRAGLVARLCVEGPLSISRLSEGSGVTRQAITKQLRTLGVAGLVRDARRGRERIYELEPRRLEKARRSLDQISADWDAAIGRLKAFVEDDREDKPSARLHQTIHQRKGRKIER
jgi:DNA-binding transcriptional ArsR family regulator